MVAFLRLHPSLPLSFPFFANNYPVSGPIHPLYRPDEDSTDFSHIFHNYSLFRANFFKLKGTSRHLIPTTVSLFPIPPPASRWTEFFFDSFFGGYGPLRRALGALVIRSVSWLIGHTPVWAVSSNQEPFFLWNGLVELFSPSPYWWSGPMCCVALLEASSFQTARSCSSHFFFRLKRRTPVLPEALYSSIFR